MFAPARFVIDPIYPCDLWISLERKKKSSGKKMCEWNLWSDYLLCTFLVTLRTTQTKTQVTDLWPLLKRRRKRKTRPISSPISPQVHQRKVCRKKTDFRRTHNVLTCSIRVYTMDWTTMDNMLWKANTCGVTAWACVTYFFYFFVVRFKMWRDISKKEKKRQLDSFVLFRGWPALFDSFLFFFFLKNAAQTPTSAPSHHT